MTEDKKFIENTLLTTVFAECDHPSGLEKLVNWIYESIIDVDGDDVNTGTIATHFRYWIEQQLENID